MWCILDPIFQNPNPNILDPPIEHKRWRNKVVWWWMMMMMMILLFGYTKYHTFAKSSSLLSFILILVLPSLSLFSSFPLSPTFCSSSSLKFLTMVSFGKPRLVPPHYGNLHSMGANKVSSISPSPSCLPLHCLKMVSNILFLSICIHQYNNYFIIIIIIIIYYWLQLPFKWPYHYWVLQVFNLLAFLFHEPTPPKYWSQNKAM